MGIILEGSNQVMVKQSLCFSFKASKNEAKYEALIGEKLLAKEMGANGLTSKSNLQLITRQVSREFHARDPYLAK